MDFGWIVERAKSAILFIPENKFGEFTKDNSYTNSLIYLGVMGFISIVLATLVAGLMELGIDPNKAAITFGSLILIPITLAVSIVMYYVGYGISHLMIKILGGKAPFVKTAQIYIYGSTPTFLLGWIPVVGIIAQLIALSNIVLGVKNVHQMSLLRSIIAVILLPLILVGIIAAILVLLLGAAFFSIVGSGVPIPMQ